MISADGYHLTAPHPEGLGAAKVMRHALANAQITSADVDYINTHGTSTPLGDISEVLAIKNVFGANISTLSISATKSMTGHLLGAAGAIEAIAAILAMKHSIVPPTINQFNLDPQIERFDFTFNVAKERPVNIALSNTFGFGGHNATLVLKKF